MPHEPVSQAYARGLLLSCLATLSITPSSTGSPSDKQVLQGYVHEIPAQTKIGIVFDWTIDSEATQDGDEFFAKTTEDQKIDDRIVLPAGSVIIGRSFRANPHVHVRGKNCINLKFDTIDSKSGRCCIEAHLVARNGTVHIRRGRQSVSIPVTVLPVTRSAPICTWGNQKSTHKDPSLYRQPKSAAVPGTQSQILFSKKRYEIKPGDEMTIELDEALRIPLPAQN